MNHTQRNVTMLLFCLIKAVSQPFSFDYYASNIKFRQRIIQEAAVEKDVFKNLNKPFKV